MKQIIESQIKFFNTGKTKDINFRLDALKKLHGAIIENENALREAIYKDLNKSEAEVYSCELTPVYEELKYVEKHLKSWAKAKSVKRNMLSFFSKAQIYQEPYGHVLILAPWNYPIVLTLMPLISAIAAGNCVTIKCSKSSKHTAKVIQKIINSTFASEYIFCADPEIAYDEILAPRYDYIFFTGSPRVGKQIMEIAAKNLTPVTLELGGKSPCIIDKSANLKLAAKRILWAKCLNAGQTCITIDYILVDNTVKARLIDELRMQIESEYMLAELDENYPKIINEHHFNRLCNLLDTEEKVLGGSTNPLSRKIAPALLPNADFDHEIMQEEIFGPLLPIIGYDNIDEIIDKLQTLEKPLACYIFTNDKAFKNKCLNNLSFGGGGVNDVFLHIANPNLPFGGVGNSGMGQYHGKHGFETFSHQKSVITGTSFFDPHFRYMSYLRNHLKTFKMLFIK